jgi:hypothetical protein
MKPEETIARTFLETYFRKDPLYEPLGRSLVPDFSIDSTAFEVRRLNQNYVCDDGRTEGLERVSYSLNTAVRGELSKIQFRPAVGSFYWSISYERPLRAEVGIIAKEIARVAASCYFAVPKGRRTAAAHGVTAEFIPATSAYKHAFVSGYEVDGDSGGFVGDIYLKNIRLALSDKIKKTQIVAPKFDRWVLVLVDSIMSDTSWVGELGSIILDLQHFNSVVVIDSNRVLTMEWPAKSLRLSA